MNTDKAKHRDKVKVRKEMRASERQKKNPIYSNEAEVQKRKATKAAWERKQALKSVAEVDRSNTGVTDGRH